MKTCKKLFSLLLVAVMLVAAIPFASFADEAGGAAAGEPAVGEPVVGEPAAAPAAAAAAAPATTYKVVVVCSNDSNYSKGEKPTTYAGTPTAANQADAINVLRNAGRNGIADKIENGTLTFDSCSFDTSTNTLTVNVTVAAPTPTPVTHNYVNKVAGSGKDHPEGHLMMCDGITCHTPGCNASEWQAHNAAEMTLKNQKAATCTAEGYTGDEVYACGYTKKGAAIPKVAHSFTDDKGKCANCAAVKYQINVTVDGNAKNETYVDEAGTAVLDKASKVMPLIGLDPTKYTAGSTFVNTGYVISFTATTIPATPAPAASYSKVVVVYCDENGNVKTNAGKTVILTTPYTGSTANNDAQGILKHAGIGESVSNYASATVAVSGDTITVTLTDKVDTRYVLNLTVVSGTTTTPKTYRVAYTGSVDTMSVLKGFGVDKEFNLDNYTYSTLGYDNNKTFTLTMTAKPTAADKYTVNCIVNGVQFASKTDVSYVGSFESNITNAQAILNAAGIQKTASEYKKVTITKSNTNVVTVDLRNTVVVRVYNNANSYSEVTMDVGQPYVNYLGTNLINNSTFGGITVKDTSDRNTYYSASQVNGGTALVSAFDKEITIQRNGDSCTLYFLRSDGTVLESRKLYAGDQIGTLPSYIVGNVPAVWTYNGKPISATDVYNFKTTSVNIVPYFGGISDVYVDVYTNGNVKTMQTRVKVTDLVQNGVLYLNSEVKSAISSALRNTSNKNLTYTAFFDASSWSDFIKTKNTNGAAEPIRVGDNSERQGAVYLYVMVNNVTQKATDSTNPKTGDDVKLGVAAAVLAVAVVGFGAVIVINKKKGAI